MGMLPHIIIIGMPMPIMAIMRSQHIFIMSMLMPAIGFMVMTMPSGPISQLICAIAMGMGMGIMPIIGIGIICPIIGIAPIWFIMGMGMGIICPIIGIMGIVSVIGICIAGIMSCILFVSAEGGQLFNLSRRPLISKRH